MIENNIFGGKTFFLGTYRAGGKVDNERKTQTMFFTARAPEQVQMIENNQYSPEQVLEFMEAVLPELEEMEFVHRYSWFSTSTSNENYAKTATSVLIDDDNQITPLGEFYANFTED